MKHITQICLLLLFICLSSPTLEANSYFCNGSEIKVNDSALAHVDSLIDMAINHRIDVESSLDEIGKKVICISEENGFDDRLVYGHLFIGMHHYFHAQMDSALHYLYLSNNEALQIENAGLLARSNNYLGLCFQSLGYHNIALSYQQDLYAYGLRTKSTSTMVQALTNLGSIYHNAGEFLKGKESNLEALKLIENKESESENALWLYRSLAMNLQMLEKKDEALSYYKKAIEKGMALNLERGKMWTFYNLADFYVEQNVDSAAYYLDKGLVIAETFDNANMSAALLYQSARINRKKGNKTKALEQCEEVVSIAQDNNLRDLEKSALVLAIHISRVEKIPIRELRYLRTLQEHNVNYVNDYISKSVGKWAENQKIIVGQKSENLVLKEAEIEKNRRLTNQNIIIIIIVFIILGLGLFLSQNVILRKKTNEYNKALLIKNNDIATQLKVIQGQKVELEKAYEQIELKQSKLKNKLAKKMIYIANKREMLDELSRALDETKLSKTVRNKINRHIQSHNRETIWEEFDQEFSANNERFFSRLAKISPKLTSNDFRLAAMIKMNLSNKEIARLLFRSVDSIHMAKSRLRKKLNLFKESMNLVAYFNYIMSAETIESATDVNSTK